MATLKIDRSIVGLVASLINQLVPHDHCVEDSQLLQNSLIKPLTRVPLILFLSHIKVYIN
jgi:hypothetical protein